MDNAPFLTENLQAEGPATDITKPPVLRENGDCGLRVLFVLAMVGLALLLGSALWQVALP